MGAPSKRARKIRTASEFDTQRLSIELNTPTANSEIYAWSLEQIFAARDAQMSGKFKLAARLAESMRTDDALFVAYSTRLDPQRCIKVALTPSKGARGKSQADEADALFGQEGVSVQRDTLADINGCFVNHGVAFAFVSWALRDDGSRWDPKVKYWPIEFVRWDPTKRAFVTQVENGIEETIVHGDGRWIVFQTHEVESWKQEAAILPAAIIWAVHAYARRDWAKGSVAHGNAKVVGELPEGVALQEKDADGNARLTAEAVAFQTLLRALASSDTPVGIRPAGAKTEWIANSSNAWQIFKELVGSGDTSATRIYLGTDAVLGAQGGAPGVDVEALFGVAATRVEGDLKCIERGLREGVIEIWCALNFGDSKLAPTRKYLVPDGDEEALAATLGTRSASFYADLKGAKDAGLPLTQDFIDGLAEDYGVRAPKLPPAPATVPATSTPTALRSVAR